MASVEYERIERKIELILGNNKRFDRTPKKIYTVKNRGILDSIFNKAIKEEFKEMLIGFIDILEEPTLTNTPNYRRVLAYTENDYLKLFESFGFEIGTWLTKTKNIDASNNKSFFNFPLFFKESCRKCSIPRYFTMSEEDIEKILTKTIDLRHCKSLVPRKDRENIEDEINVVMHPISTTMNDYNKRGISSTCSWLARNMKDAKVLRVSEDFGEGYGFDALAVIDGREALAVVKADDSNESFILSKNEYDMMTRSVRQPYTSFTIHKYLYNIDNKNECLMHTVYGYDSENEVLVDIEDDTNICNIERKEFTGKNGAKKVRYICTPVKFKYVKEDHTLKKVFRPEESSK